MLVSRENHVGLNHNIKISYDSFERVGQFKYLGRNVNSKLPFMKKLKADVRASAILHSVVVNLYRRRNVGKELSLYAE